MDDTQDARSTLPTSVNSSTDPNSLQTLQIPRLCGASSIHHDNKVMSPNPEDVIGQNRPTDVEAIPEGIVRRGMRATAATTAAASTFTLFSATPTSTNPGTLQRNTPRDDQDAPRYQDHTVRESEGLHDQSWTGIQFEGDTATGVSNSMKLAN
eukprot:4650193-Amphidinium_carterae.2